MARLSPVSGDGERSCRTSDNSTQAPAVPAVCVWFFRTCFNQLPLCSNQSRLHTYPRACQGGANARERDQSQLINGLVGIGV